MKRDAQLPANTLPQEVRSGIETALKQRYGTSLFTGDFKIIAGGCINHGGRLVTSSGEFFVKWNSLRNNPSLFELEAKGLLLLASANVIRIPEVVETGITDDYQFIVIEFIEAAEMRADFWEDFGRRLASLHRCKGKLFGLEYDNYIGSLRQTNNVSSSWVEFFKIERLSKQLMMAEQSGLTDHSLRKKFETIFGKLDDLILDGDPVLLHGDLWSGNVVADENGKVCLIDPAVYFGNSEMEIAYTRLFGGFPDAFYNAYHEINPLLPGFNERASLYQLYPLLVHVNLFGKKYLGAIEEILSRFE